MSKKFDPPDSIGLNELRIAKEDLSDFQITKFYFSPDQARQVKSYLHQKACVVVYGGKQFFYVMRTRRDDDLKKDMPSQLKIEHQDSMRFNQLHKEIARRFLFSMIEEMAKSKGYVRGEGWQLYAPNKQREGLPHGYETINIGIREEDSFYRVYLDPTTLVLVPLPLLQPNQLVKGRLLRKLVAQEDKLRMEHFDFSIYPGRAGYFEQFDDSAIQQITPDSMVYVKPKMDSEGLVSYPAFALRIIAKRSEFGVFNIDPMNAQKQLQPLPTRRLRETKKWISLLFPNDQLRLNDRTFSIVNHTDKFEQATTYRVLEKKAKSLYYQSTPLLFDAKGNKTDFSQKPGLKKFKPYDSNSPNRPFNTIRPYLIIPGGEQSFKAVNQFMDFLSGDYKRRSGTAFPDDDFNGIKEHFDVEYGIPDEDDIVIVEDATSIEYLQAAERILHSWAGESENKDRIVIVIVAHQSNNEDDPYIPLKKKFVEAGLPSQMIEMDTLNQMNKANVPFGHTLWTFALDLYVKLGGKPWALARPINNVNCLIGLGFGRSPRRLSNPIYVGIANIFDQGGQWLDLNSDDRELTNEEWQSLKDKEQSLHGTSSFKLHHEMSASIIASSLDSYNASTNQIAQKVVFHKNGDIYESEALGFLQALSENVLRNKLPLASAKFALVSIYKNHDVRMYGPSFPTDIKMDNTITKGSVQILNANTAVIATTGKNPFGYFGIGTPTPLIVQRFIPSQETFSSTGFNTNQMYSIEEICEHVISLTRLHWGSTNDIRLPITSEYAQRIAEFLASTDVSVDFLLKSKRLWWI